MISKMKSKLSFTFILLIGLFTLFEMMVFLNHHLGISVYHMHTSVLGSKEHSVVGSILTSLFIVILARMVWQFVKQIYLLSRWNKSFQRNKDNQATIELNEKFPSLNNNIIVIQNEDLIALTIGFLNPKVVISNAWLEHFSVDEVEAVLLHEHFHCLQRDPLKFLVIRIFNEGFLYLPILRNLVGYYKTWRELLADRYAMDKMKNSLHLGSVLLKLARHLPVRGEKPSYQEITAQFADIELNYRIQQIINPQNVVHVPLLRKKKFIISVLLFAVNILIFISCVDSQFALHHFLY